MPTLNDLFDGVNKAVSDPSRAGSDLSTHSELSSQLALTERKLIEAEKQLSRLQSQQLSQQSRLQSTVTSAAHRAYLDMEQRLARSEERRVEAEGKLAALQQRVDRGEVGRGGCGDVTVDAAAYIRHLEERCREVQAQHLKETLALKLELEQAREQRRKAAVTTP